MQNKYRSACRRRWSRKWNKSGGERSFEWRCYCYKRRSERLLLFPSPLFSFLFFCYVSLSFCYSLSVFHLLFLFPFQYRPFHLALTVPLPCFKLPHLLSFLSLSAPLFSLFFFSQFLLFLSSYAGVDSSIYRAKGSGGVPNAALSLCMGSRAFLPCHSTGLGGQWACFTGTASLASHYEGACVLTEHVGRERGKKNYIGKKQKFHSSPAARLREEEGGTVSLKTTPFCSLCFFFTWNNVVLDKTRRFI